MYELLVEHGSYAGIIVFMLLTGAGMPLPEEVAIVTSGILSAQGTMDPWLASGACLVGALLGDCIMYGLGRRYGHRMLRKRRWWTPKREKDIEHRLQNHGFKVLFVARFLVGLRSPVYLAAGVLRMPFRRFVAYDLVAATTVIATFFSLSYFLSEKYGDVVYEWIRTGEVALTLTVVVAILITAVVLYVRHRRRKARDDDDDDDFLDEEEEEED